MLNPDRFFDTDPSIKNIARDLYSEVKDLPIISPHGHTDPKWFADNTPFSNATDLIIISDHYIFRLLYSQGISMESIGIPSIDGTRVEQDKFKIWRIFSKNYYLFSGTPTGIWLEYIFKNIFNIEKDLNQDSSKKIYECINDKLKSKEFLPRSLYEKFNIEVLSTTDNPSDKLVSHKKINESSWDARIIPCFRPDSIINISDDQWINSIKKLESVVGYSIDSFSKYIEAIEERRSYFKEMGATSTDIGIVNPFTFELSNNEIESIFSKALAIKSSLNDSKLFTAHMLMEMARMSVEDGLVMQIHGGSYRNYNKQIYSKFGRDKGADIPLRTEYTNNLYQLLNKYGNDTNFKLIIFTLDESTYSRELAPLAGHFPSLKLGPAWWFHDSIEGMKRYRELTTETASIYNTVGFNDDTRNLLSIPARHDLYRRINSNYLARLVATYRMDKAEAKRVNHALSYSLAKENYNL